MEGAHTMSELKVREFHGVGVVVDDAVPHGMIIVSPSMWDAMTSQEEHLRHRAELKNVAAEVAKATAKDQGVGQGSPHT